MEENTDLNIIDGEITGIRFSLASHYEVCKSSVNECPINHASQLSNPFLGLPLEAGKCESCGTHEPEKCEGHFGYIELPIPIFHPSHVIELRRMLSIMCLNCLKLKPSKAPSNASGMVEMIMPSCCSVCDVIVKENTNNDGAVSLELRFPGRRKKQGGEWSFLKQYGGFAPGDSNTRALLPIEVLKMLKKIPKGTKRKLEKKGYFPQDGYILKYLPVPPNCLSIPDVSDGISVMSTDVSSAMLKKVLRQIELIKSSRSGEPNFPAHEVEANELQVAVTQYLQVRGTGAATREKGRPYGAGKEVSQSSTKAWLEKMRTLFISKGSGFSSRTVITGDAYKRVNEIGLPMEIAQKMTFEEKVNIHNINFLQNLVDNNLCLVYKDKSTMYSLREGSKGHTYLRPGQVVHRRIMDGDVVFINRPPTTHKHSLQALSVYIHEDHTVKINPLMCGPLSADFDGDCVHLFYPQSLAARAETIELFSVEKQLLSSHSGNLNLQLSADSLLSIKVMLNLFFLGKADAQQLAMFASAELPPAAFPKASISGPFWTALQVLQTALPPNFNCNGDRQLIRRSEMLKIDFNRDAVLSMMNEIASSILFENGSKEALNFFDSLQPLLMENLFSEGFSVCLRDFYIESSILSFIQRKLQDISPLLFQLRSCYNELVEMQVENDLRKMKGHTIAFIMKSSALGMLIDSRSESGINKIIQQIGFLGLQLYDRGKLYSRDMVKDLVSLFKRTYPYSADFPCLEYGLVKSCFIHGLDPYEEMVHSVATREVILRSSKGLAEPGTLFKNLMAILRDVVICYDGTVRNVSSNSVIQFDYGVIGEKSKTLFPAGEPVGVLAATAMSNPAYKAVLDSSSSSNNSWSMMKEILFCPVNFKNQAIDRRVILYLNECECGRSYCPEKASLMLKNLLRKVTLKDAAVELLIEYKSAFASEPYEMEAGLVGHIHLSKALLNESNINMDDVLAKCEEQLPVLKRKKSVGAYFKGMHLSISECCCFGEGRSKWHNMPCLKFSWQGQSGHNQLDQLSHIMADMMCPLLLDTVIKGDPRISTVTITWINPDTMMAIKNPYQRGNGELAVEVMLEKTSVKRSGDAWRIVLDCCLPVFHMIDVKRSMPCAIKQIEDMFGISSAFDQAVQRLSTSVTMVARGLLKEHLLLLASSMTCTGNLIGFNMSGIKALHRALGVQVPFTQATLYTPRKCFERAAEKCHVDPLSSIVASCSWGKPVAVGTGAKFDILWDGKETKLDEGGIDVYNFLHLVRGGEDREIGSGCLGDDVENFQLEDGFVEDGDCEAVFEDNISVEMDLENAPSFGVETGTSAWEKSSSRLPVKDSGGWESKENGDSGTKIPSESGGWSSWGPNTAHVKGKDAGPGQSSATKSWGEPDHPSPWDKQENENGNVPGGDQASGWSNWGAAKANTEGEDKEVAQTWGKCNNTGSESGSWASGSAHPEEDNNARLGGFDGSTRWGKTDQPGGSSWGHRNVQSEDKDAEMVGSDISKNWGKTGQSGGGSSWGHHNVQSEDKDAEMVGCDISKNWGKTGQSGGGSSWGRDNIDSKDEDLGPGGSGKGTSWGKTSQSVGGSSWGHSNSHSEDKDAGLGGFDKGTSWGKTSQSVAVSSWGHRNSHSEDKDAGLCKSDKGTSWGKSSHSVGGSSWGHSKVHSDDKDVELGGSDKGMSWGKTSQSVVAGSSWGCGNAHSEDKGAGLGMSDASKNWEKTDHPSSSWAQQENVDVGPQVTCSGGGWESKDSNANEAKSCWGQPSPPSAFEKTGDENHQSWGNWKASSQANDNQDESESPWGQAGGWKKNRDSGWGSSENSEWKNKRSRPAKPPGSSNEGFRVNLYTATRQRLDLFTSEEKEVLSELEGLMQSIRRIMHRPGYNDGDALPPDDQTYIMDNVFSHHPQKEAKMGAGFDHFIVAKHTTFQDSRCLHVVSHDGTKEDFSYIKCLENYVQGKYPDVAESFNSKYFKRLRNPREQSSPRIHEGQQREQGSPRIDERQQRVSIDTEGSQGQELPHNGDGIDTQGNQGQELPHNGDGDDAEQETPGAS